MVRMMLPSLALCAGAQDFLKPLNGTAEDCNCAWCDCGWAKDPSSCCTGDGSCCFNCCCDKLEDEVTTTAGASRRRHGVASTTRYWDCNQPMCAWAGVCKESADHSGKYAAPWNKIWKDKTTGKIYGTVATSSSLGMGCRGKGLKACGNCYRLTVLDGPATGKKLEVMATNWCSDQPNCPITPHDTNPWGQHYHFDIAIPGGGQGMKPMCDHQYGGNYNWKTWSRDQCSQLPNKHGLQGSCHLWWDDLHGMNNPKVAWKKIKCPAAFHNKCQSLSNATELGTEEDDVEEELV